MLHIMTSEQLFDFIKDDSNEEDPMWRMGELTITFPYFFDIFPYTKMTSERFIFFLEIDEKGEIIAIAKIKLDGVESMVNRGHKEWLCFIIVKEEYRNQGIGTKIVYEITNFLKENGYKKFWIGGYTKDALNYIRETFYKACEKDGIELFDREKIIY